MIIPTLKKWLQRSPSTPRTICILGMHRSGTSFLTGSLQQAGLELHRVHEQNPHNLKGNRENPAIMQLNDWILDSNGGSWDNPPDSPRWSEAQFAQGKDIVAQYESYSIWGFKDPRVLITLQGWRELMPDVEFVGIFRHPLLVAQSLNRRNEKISLEKGLELWRIYNELLLRLYGQENFPILEFDPAAEDMGTVAQNLARSLRLPRPAAIQFFEEELVNQKQFNDDFMDDATTRLYRELQSIARTGW